MRRLSLSLAAVLALIYLCVALAAATCLFGAGVSHHPAHHHHASPMHSALCAWACQASPEFAAASASPLIGVLLVVSAVALPLILSSSNRLPLRVRSRAPPR